MMNELKALETIRDEKLANKVIAEARYNAAIDNYDWTLGSDELDGARAQMNRAIAAWYEACDACVACFKRLNA
jgi:hypothetical protein